MLYSHSKGDVGEAYNANVKQKAKKYRQVLQTFGRKNFPRIFSFLYKKAKFCKGAPLLEDVVDFRWRFS